MIEQFLQILGKKVTDRVTGYSGIVESVTFDLYGCVQAIVRAPVNEKMEMQECRWFDYKRLLDSNEERVMPLPAFELVPGPAERPKSADRPKQR